MPIYFVRTDEGATFMRSAPPGTPRWHDVIQLGESICGSDHLHLLDFTEGAGQRWTAQPAYTYSLPHLKSNFQKTMRRQLVEPCLATAKQLLVQDPVDFLRRLAVVLLEDSLLQPALYSQVIWLMYAVGKRYTLKVNDVQVIFDAIVTGLESMKRYDLAAEPAAPVTDADLWLRSHEERDSYLSIRLRSLAGGMKCDTSFLRRLAFRALRSQLGIEGEISTIDLTEIPDFDPDRHMVCWAIDFHCSSYVLGEVALGCGISREEAKALIWWHWSSLNERSCETEAQRLEEVAHRFRYAEHAAEMTQRMMAVSQSAIRDMKAMRTKVIQNNTLDRWFKITP